MDLELERLYLLYQAGSKTDGKKNSYTLQVAQAVGNDLTREEFEAVHSQVKQIESQFDPRKQTTKFQESLWTLPDEIKEKRETDFKPTRTATNEPVQYEDSSPASLQKFLKTKSLEDVKHDSTLRNAWHAAQSDKLEELASTNNLWIASTDRDELAKELGSLPASIGVDSLGWSLNNLRVANNEGKLDEELAKERKQAERDLPSAMTYQSYDADAMRKRILSNQGSEFSFIDKSLRDDVHGGHSLADIAKLDKPLRDDAARAWVEGFRKKHEDSIPKAIVDRRMKGMVASQLPARKESKQHTSQELLHSVMKAGFRSRDTAVPPVQVHYSPFSNAQTSRSTPQATRKETQSRSNVNRSPAIQPRAEKGSVDASLAVHHSMSTDTNVSQRDLGPKESPRHSMDANANQPVRSPENTNSSPSVQPSYSEPETEVQPENEEEENSFNSLDYLQLMLDGVGVFEPTPFADVTNAGISLTRAIADPANAGRHLKNAGLSLISTLPYLGDVAKLAKGYGKTGKAVGNSIDAFASSKAPKLLEWFGASGKKQYSKDLKGTEENQSSSTGGFLGSLAGIFGQGNSGKSNRPQQQHSPGGGSSGNGAGSGRIGVTPSNGGSGSGFASSANDPKETENRLDAINLGGGSGKGGSGSPPSFGGNLSGGPFGMMGGGNGGIGEGLSKLTIVVGAAIAAFRLLNNWVNKTAERGKAMVEANREMALYSGQMSTAMLQYDNREVLRKMDEAAYLGSSGASLAQSQSDLEDSRSDHNKPYARTWNNIQSYTNQAATLLSEILQFADPIRALLERIYSAVDDGKKKDLDSNDAFEEMIRQNNAIPLANPKPNVKLPANMNNAIRKGGGLP